MPSRSGFGVGAGSGAGSGSGNDDHRGGGGGGGDDGPPWMMDPSSGDVTTVDGGLELSQPANATRPAWWETLNSTAPGVPGGGLLAVAGFQNGRRCGLGVREMTTSDQGTLAVRCTKTYLRMVDARDM